ncbi:MAG: crosslink repair DNA glycosylase YcaQ family protein, partial [Myxococcota bacterium]
MASVSITTEQVRAFRARRTLLTEPGASGIAEAARRILGLQAQVDSCALHALSMRCAQRPDQVAIKRAILEDRALVRTWGQRDTLHLFAAEDLPWIIAARGLWKQTGRRGGMPPEELLDDMAALFEAADGALVRSDLFSHIPAEYVDALRDHPGAGKDPQRFAASRIIWRLAYRGDIVFASKAGREQSYAWRGSWLPQLEWVEHDAWDACVALTESGAQPDHLAGWLIAVGKRKA